MAFLQAATLPNLHIAWNIQQAAFWASYLQSHYLVIKGFLLKREAQNMPDCIELIQGPIYQL